MERNRYTNITISQHEISHTCSLSLSYPSCIEQNPTILSMSVLLGAAAFGPAGVIIAPIASGITLVILDMYKK